MVAAAAGEESVGCLSAGFLAAAEASLFMGGSSADAQAAASHSVAIDQPFTRHKESDFLQRTHIRHSWQPRANP